MSISLYLSNVSNELPKKQQELAEVGKEISKTTKTYKDIMNGKILTSTIGGALTIEDALVNLGLHKLIERRDNIKKDIAKIETKSNLTTLIADSVKKLCIEPISLIVSYFTE